ncbi:HDOD domain-containing protein [Methylomonas sp. LW13]|uniref:HDOD domain-containing protein n=1 Tax=unclassified Methylomonas TaxID=2608980 RepID=UPI00051C326D|nr:HDOD domain-containing protein [Methylomonas sp. LW13]QBC27053.1 HDOD domain-containing protein [Methylomonas sp. LW13]
MNTKSQATLLADLPSLPTVIMDALQFTADKQNLSNLANKISQDPHMAVRILRVANSPFYGRSREIGSLQEAVVVLGLNRVKNLLLGLGFMNLFRLDRQDFDYSQFWHHSMAVAECARQLAIHTGMDQDIAFTAGLLHDIGLLAIVLLFPDDFSRITTGQHLNRIEAERHVLGFDHAEIGCNVAKHWNLPMAIQHAIEQHEIPRGQDEGKSLELMIHMANFLVLATQRDDQAFEYPESIVQILEMLNIPLDQAIDWANSSQQFANQVVASL